MSGTGTGRDPVTPELRRRVLERDRGCCMAPILDPSQHPLRDCGGGLQLDHVKDRPKVGEPIVKRGPHRKRRYRAPSDEAHLVTLCEAHHLGGWATANRPRLRRYLSEVSPADPPDGVRLGARDGDPPGPPQG